MSNVAWQEEGLTELVTCGVAKQSQKADVYPGFEPSIRCRADVRYTRSMLQGTQIAHALTAVFEPLIPVRR